MKMPRMAKRPALGAFLAAALVAAARAAAAADGTPDEPLRNEVGKKGWIVIAAYTQEVETQKRLPDDEAGQADLYLMRPDGSEMRNITRTPDVHEFFARFSADGRKIMFRRLRKSKDIEHDAVGTQGALVTAASDGSGAVAFGQNGEYPWATWSPDARQIACLYKNEDVIRIFDFETQKQVREMPAHGIFQQMVWSPDGRNLCGTAKVKGEMWNIVALDLATQEVKVLSRHLNCTPNWLKDGSGVVNSCRNPAWGRKGGKGEPYGNTVLVQAALAGPAPALLYADIDAHIYNGFTSPDDRYVAFHAGQSEGGTRGDPAKHRCFYVMRRADGPILQPGFDALAALHPKAGSGPVLQARFPDGRPLVTVFVAGDWTYAEIGPAK
ncbi:MAG: PD40 domain-containing protein [Planctomycetes bacterium]|nr:PD40 domain-containing protein [Planctomycetota bacterium]